MQRSSRPWTVAVKEQWWPLKLRLLSPPARLFGQHDPTPACDIGPAPRWKRSRLSCLLAKPLGLPGSASSKSRLECFLYQLVDVGGQTLRCSPTFLVNVVRLPGKRSDFVLLFGILLRLSFL